MCLETGYGIRLEAEFRLHSINNDKLARNVFKLVPASLYWCKRAKNLTRHSSAPADTRTIKILFSTYDIDIHDQLGAYLVNLGI